MIAQDLKRLAQQSLAQVEQNAPQRPGHAAAQRQPTRAGVGDPVALGRGQVVAAALARASSV